MSTARKFKRSKPPQAPAPPELRRWARAVNWLFAKLPPRMRLVVLRLKLAAQRWWLNPAAHPDDIGKRGRYEYRPARIALSFDLHADGSVAFLNRLGGPDEWVSDPHLVGLVHREYKRLVAHGVATQQVASRPRNEGT